MSPNHDHQAELLRRMLARSEQPSTTDHIDLETIALFAQDALAADQRQRVVEHLADCSLCRSTASELVKLEAESSQAGAPTTISLASARREGLSTRSLTLLALAACLLVAVTIALKSSRPVHNDGPDPLLVQKDNPAAPQNPDPPSDQHGNDSGGVSATMSGSVQSQSSDLKGTAPETSPDSADVLTKKGLRTAKELIADVDQKDLAEILTRGQMALSKGRAADALDVFEHAVELAPKNALAWLGRGLASFMLERLPVAEDDFRKSIELDPNLIAAHIDLAITLEDEGLKLEALAEWQSLLERPLSDNDHQAAEQAIKRLREL